MQGPGLDCFEGFLGSGVALITQTSTCDWRTCGVCVAEDFEGQFQEVEVVGQLLHAP